MSVRNRRRDARVKVSFPADRHRGGMLEAGTVIEASARGLQVRVSDPPPNIGELIRLTVHLPDAIVPLHVVPVRTLRMSSCNVVACRIFVIGVAEREIWERAVLGEIRDQARAA